MEKEPSSLTIANRTASRANQLVSRFQQYLNIDACGIDALKPNQPYDIIINATSAAITSTSIDFPCFIIAKNTICYDLSYRLIANTVHAMGNGKWSRMCNSRVGNADRTSCRILPHMEKNKTGYLCDIKATQY